MENDNIPVCKSGIYIILNTKNGKCYIGSAVNIRARLAAHHRYLRRNVHNNRYLQQAYNKHGAEAFTNKVLEYVEDVSALISREQYYLDTLHPEYNLSPTAGNNLGLKRRPHSVETRRRIGEKSKGRPAWNKGKHPSEVTRKRLSEAGRKRAPIPRTEIWKQRIGESNTGRTCSEATRLKLKESHEGKTVSEATRLKQSKISKERGISEETRRKMNASHKEYVATEEHRRHLSESCKKRQDIRGEDNVTAKLTTKQVIEIRYLYLQGISYRQLIQMFGMSKSAIASICSYKTWQHISEDAIKEYVPSEETKRKLNETIKVEPRKGENHHKAKLTKEQVLEIRLLHEQGLSYDKLAQTFNMDRSSIADICTRRHWKHI